MSDTSETDKHPLWHGEPAVHIDFARSLERERNQWKKMYEEADWHTVEAEVFKRERNEARIQYRSTLALAEVLANTQVKLKAERDEIAALVRRLFEILDTVEVSDSETEFHPTVIRSCRIMHTQELNELLPKLKEAAK